MTIEELRSLKGQAENAILKILNELQDATGHRAEDIYIRTIDVTVKDSGPKFLINDVEITLKV